MVMESELKKLGLHYLSVSLGEVELKEDCTEVQKKELCKKLQALGFDLIEDKKSQTIERIKILVIELVFDKNNLLTTNLSDYLSANLGQDYSALSNLFSEVEGNNI